MQPSTAQIYPNTGTFNKSFLAANAGLNYEIITSISSQDEWLAMYVEICLGET